VISNQRPTRDSSGDTEEVTGPDTSKLGLSRDI
jgi:hypothetical protein